MACAAVPLSLLLLLLLLMPIFIRIWSGAQHVKLIVAAIVIFRRETIDRVDEATRKGGLVEERVVGTQKIVALVANRAVMIHLTLERYVRIVTIVSTFA